MFCQKWKSWRKNMSSILEFVREEDRETFINEFRHQADMIKDLQEKLALTEKALELACKCIPCKECPHSDGISFCYIASEDGSSPNEWECNTAKYSYFIEQAEKELKGE